MKNDPSDELIQESMVQAGDFYALKAATNAEAKSSKHKYTKIINRVLEASSIDSEIKRILSKVLNKGNLAAPVKDHERLRQYAEQILEKTSVEDLFRIFNFSAEKFYYSYEESIDILKFFLLNQNEREYLDEIKEEIKVGEQLDDEIGTLAEQVDFENIKTIKRDFELNPSTKKLQTEIDHFEARLEKAHQKLNLAVYNNVKLRNRIDLLRKEKHIVEEIYMSLRAELQNKRDQIENTILEAGRANINRNIAENQLKELIEKARAQKEDFEKEYRVINEEIEKDKKFCEFLKEKQKDRQRLNQLEDDIKKNQEYIKEKRQQHEKMTREYMESEQKDLELRNALEKLKEHTGVDNCDELLPLFQNLYDKHKTISVFVDELENELEELDARIDHAKENIKLYNVQGAPENELKHKEKQMLDQKTRDEEFKMQLLKVQEQSATDTIKKIKDYLTSVFEAVGIDNEEIVSLQNTNLNLTNVAHFFGLLEDKGMKIIEDYSKLIAEQIKKEKGDNVENVDQINNLLNIIEMEQKEMALEQQMTAKNDFPEQLLDIEPLMENTNDQKFKNYDELKHQALDEMNKYLRIGKLSSNRSQNKRPVLNQSKQTAVN
jgi:hypothetical protein